MIQRRGKIALVFIASTYDDVIMRSSTFNMWERRRLAKIHSLFFITDVFSSSSLLPATNNHMLHAMLDEIFRKEFTCERNSRAEKTWQWFKKSLPKQHRRKRILIPFSRISDMNFEGWKLSCACDMGGKSSFDSFTFPPLLTPSSSCWLLCENVNSLAVATAAAKSDKFQFYVCMWNEMRCSNEALIQPPSSRTRAVMKSHKK